MHVNSVSILEFFGLTEADVPAVRLINMEGTVRQCDDVDCLMD